MVDGCHVNKGSSDKVGDVMDDLRLHLALSSTLLVLVVGSLVMLAPQFTELRTSLGLPAHFPGSRFNHSVGAAEIISEEGGRDYLARLTFIYHSVFALLIYATMIPLIARKELGRELMNLLSVGAVMTVVGGLAYSYVQPFHLWHGLFVTGLAAIFLAGLMVLLRMRPDDLVGSNIRLTGLLMLAGSMIGGYLGSSFMEGRSDFVRALIEARFNPDLAEEIPLWRALTAHEHAMLLLALTLVFLTAISLLGVEERGISRLALHLIWFGQLLAAVASFAVWPFGKTAHLIITPAALILLLGTTLLSFKARGDSLKWGLVAGNLIMWLSVTIPGALVAMSLRKPLFFDPPFRDPAWDWAELAYNVGHWHILLGMWGITVLLIYLSWPVDLMGTSRTAKLGGWLSLLGFGAAAISVNLYMLGNPPGPYSPNPYSNIWLTYLVEPSLVVMSLGIFISYVCLMGSLKEGLFWPSSELEMER